MKHPETSLAAKPQRRAAKRLGGAGIVVLLHAGLAAALVAGMAQRVVRVPPQPVMASLLHEPPPAQPPAPAAPMVKPAAAPPVRPTPAPPPRPRTRPPAPTAITVPTSAAPTPVQASAPAAEPAPTAAGPAKAQPVHLPAGVDRSHSCNPPDYPPVSRRLGEEGTVVVKFLIDETGAVIDSGVESSSGHPRLDEAARDALSLCHFTPGTVDGKPERAWARIQYIWRLE